MFKDIICFSLRFSFVLYKFMLECSLIFSFLSRYFLCVLLCSCPAGGSARVLSSDDPNFQPFSFKAFSFSEDMTLVRF